MNSITNFRLIATLIFLRTISPSLANAQSAQATEFTKAIKYLSIGDFKNSEHILRELVIKNPENGLYWYNLGMSYYGAENFHMSLDSFQQAIRLRSRLAPYAQLYQIKVYRILKKNKDAFRVLTELQSQKHPPNLTSQIELELSELRPIIGDQPKDAEVGFILGDALEAYRTQEFEDALDLTNLALKESSSSTEGILLKGLIYLRMGKSQLARESFFNVLKLSTDKSSREDALELINQIKRGDWPEKKPYWLWGDLSGGYFSNYYENGPSEPVTAAPLTQFSTGVGYHFLKENSLSFELNYDFSWQEVLNLPTARIFTHSAALPIYWREASWDIGIVPSIQSQYLGFYPFLTKPSGKVYVQRQFDQHTVGVSYDYTQNISYNPYYDYLNGSTQSRKIYYGFDGRIISLGIFYVGGQESVGDLLYSNGSLPLGNHSSGPGLSFTIYLGNDLCFTTTVASYQRVFSTNAEPGNLVRKDTQAYISERIEIQLSKDLKLYASGEVWQNKSTLGPGSVADKNYDKYVSYLGLTWTALP